MNALQSFLATLPCGFLTEATLPELIKLDRLHPCLVRCGGCRFTCAAQCVPHLMKCVDAGGDYVRDVSIPAGCEDRAAQWKCPESPVTPIAMTPAHFTRERKADYRREFNESDCGGVWDGFQVTSDADPGL
jgi:hypothetical protein